MESSVRTRDDYRDTNVKKALISDGTEVESFNAALLHEPWNIRNKSGKPFQVFTPFWKHCLTKADPSKPLRAPGSLPSPPRWPNSLEIDFLELEPTIDWAAGLTAEWVPGELGAAKWLRQFLANGFDGYGENRNRPDVVGTSKLSPHLHYGELGPRQVWHGLKQMSSRCGVSDEKWRASQFLSEVGWREFAHHLLFHFPTTHTEPLHENFKGFPWREEPEWLQVWQRGRTGYPIVDAGMRELWATGWMHNRV